MYNTQPVLMDQNEPTLRDIGAAIDDRLANMTDYFRRGVDEAWRVGDLLNQAKALCGHGDWLPFLEERAIEAKSAQNYMMLARHSICKYENFSYLSDAFDESRRLKAAADKEQADAEFRAAEAQRTNLHMQTVDRHASVLTDEQLRTDLDKADARISVAAKKLAVATVRARRTTAAPGYRMSATTRNPEWYTPTEWLDMARACMGGIALDPTSSAKANERVQADAWWCADDDVLDREWIADTVWMNPPYNQPLQRNLVAKLISEHAAGNVGQAVVLALGSTDAAWWHDLARASAYFACPLGRIGFVDGETGYPMTANQLDSTIFGIGVDYGLFRDAFEARCLVCRTAE